MRRTQAGYALLVILLLASLVLIALSVGVQPLLTENQREKEEELIFRGEQYRRAIGLFYKKFGRYPTKIEELLRTNDRTFLRREFPDPMTPDGKWRLIRVGPGGEFIGSVQQVKTPGQRAVPTPETGTPPQQTPQEQPTAPTRGMESAGGFPLAGVASASTRHAFRLYDGYNRYNQWEFIYDPVKEAMRNAPPGGGGAGAGKETTKPPAKTGSPR